MDEERWLFLCVTPAKNWNVALKRGVLALNPMAYLNKVLDSAVLAPTKSSILTLISNWDTSIVHFPRLKDLLTCLVTVGGQTRSQLGGERRCVWHVRQQIWLEPHRKGAGVRFTSTSVVRLRFKWLINVYGWPKQNPGTGTNPLNSDGILGGG